MNFDRIARGYSRVERLVFGKRLEKVRCAHLDYLAQQLSPGDKVLVVGDGDGRFFERCVQAWPSCHFVFVEQSAEMVRLTKERFLQSGSEVEVEWITGDAALLDHGTYQLIVSHFVLDCHQGSELENLIRKLSGALSPGGRWMVSDFDPAATWWSGKLVALMYLFFVFAAKLPRQQWSRPDPIMSSYGLEKEASFTLWSDFIFSDVWKRPELNTQGCSRANRSSL